MRLSRILRNEICLLLFLVESAALAFPAINLGGGTAGGGGAPVAVEAQASINTVAAEALSVSFNITCAGTNRVLVIAHLMRTGGGTNDAATYNGNATTDIAEIAVAAGGMRGSLYYYPNPDTVSRAVECTFGEIRPMACGAVCLSGVNLAAPFGTADTDQLSAATALACTGAVPGGGLLIGLGGKRNSAGTLTTSDTSQHLSQTSHATGANNVQLVTATTGDGSLDFSHAASANEMLCISVPVNAAP